MSEEMRLIFAYSWLKFFNYINSSDIDEMCIGKLQKEQIA